MAVTNRNSFIVGGLTLPGNPYDSYTLKKASDHLRAICGKRIKELFVDRSYRGHDEAMKRSVRFTSRHKSAGLSPGSGNV